MELSGTRFTPRGTFEVLHRRLCKLARLVVTTLSVAGLTFLTHLVGKRGRITPSLPSCDLNMLK